MSASVFDLAVTEAVAHARAEERRLYEEALAQLRSLAAADLAIMREAYLDAAGTAIALGACPDCGQGLTECYCSTCHRALCTDCAPGEAGARVCAPCRGLQSTLERARG